jgi:mRNA interferase MazF
MGKAPHLCVRPNGTAGLPQDSVALCHQIRVLDKRGIFGRIGTLPPVVMEQIEVVVRVTLGL